jgi:rhodanese-related sulfurtransferase
LSEVPQDKPVVLYCRSGNRSNQAAQLLDRAGYTQIYDLGGIVNWVQQGYPVQ